MRATAHVFEDPSSQALLTHLERVAPSEASVLIVGESGTGKELVARHIHHRSARARHPFVAVNCGAFSESLVDAELFGHEKGAFTGALSAKAGWFEEANGGTLFLDEIGDLPMPIQVKLLRVLQEREVVRLGSRRSVPIDVRVLAATNVPLDHAIQHGYFRQDLFYRLNVVGVEPAAARTSRRHSAADPPLRRYLQPAPGTRPRDHQRGCRAPVGRVPVARQYPRAGERHPPHPADPPRRRGARRRHPSVATALARPGRRRPHEDGQALLERAFDSLFESAGGALHATVEDQLFRAAYRHCHHNQVKTAALLGLSRNIVRARLIELGELVVNKRPG